MHDREFLQWIHDRLNQVHGENEFVDYMHKLRAIINATDPDQLTPNVLTNPHIDTVQRRG
jgi:acetylornithine deacetylase/succinyl-diaminopimelate desuccinylase-like protein